MDASELILNLVQKGENQNKKFLCEFYSLLLPELLTT